MANQRVLVIAYYFPPSGGSGVQRSLKFVKYLPAFGWQPVVLTVDPERAAYPNLDPEMASDVPPDIDIHRTVSWDPYRIYAGLSRKSRESAVSVGFLSDKSITWREKLARWVRANVFVPDARVGWYFYAIKQAKKIIEAGQVDAVFTTGPPHSTHLIGRALKRKYGLPWVADFRDPWTDIDFLEELPMTGISRKLNARLEQSVLDEASTVVTISPAMQRAFTAQTQTPCRTIFNGFDEADFEGQHATSHDIFYISHVGNMNAARNPEILWRVLAKGLEEGKFSKLKVRLVGNVDAQVTQTLTALGLSSIIERIEYCPHHLAVRYMQESTVLLLLINNVFSARGIVTGKLFEYMAAGKPVLGIGPVDGDAAEILNETGAGRMLGFEDEDGLELYLSTLYQAWVKNETLPASSKTAIARYSREGQTGHLASLLDALGSKDAEIMKAKI